MNWSQLLFDFRHSPNNRMKEGRYEIAKWRHKQVWAKNNPGFEKDLSWKPNAFIAQQAFSSQCDINQNCSSHSLLSEKYILKEKIGFFDENSYFCNSTNPEWFFQESQAYNVDRNPFIVERRGYRDPDDPRWYSLLNISMPESGGGNKINPHIKSPNRKPIHCVKEEIGNPFMCKRGNTDHPSKVSGSCLLEWNECAVRVNFKSGERKTSQGKQLHWPDLKVSLVQERANETLNNLSLISERKIYLWKSFTINL